MTEQSKGFATPQVQGQSLRKLATQSFSWTALSTLVTTGLWVIIQTSLARLLSPEEFGLVGLSIVFVNFANVVNRLGLTAAIVQREDLEEVQASTAFWINLAVGCALTAMLAGASGVIARFYKRPDLAPIVVVISLSFFFNSLGSVHRALLQRNLDFKSLALVDIIALFVSAVVSIGWALAGGGAYSLAIQEVIRGLVRSVLGWAFLSWLPGFVFDWKNFRSLFSFSSTVMISDIINYISANIDHFLIGKLVGVSAVGYYGLSYTLVNLPRAKIVPLINNISFPVLSRVQDDQARLRRGYLKTVQYISLLSFPALFGLLTVAREFVYVFYGEKWAPSIILLQLLCVTGLIYSFATTVGSFLFPCGRPDLVLRGNIYRFFLLGGSVLVGTHWGITGVAAAVSVYMVVFLLQLYLWFLWKAGRLSPWALLRSLAPAFISSLVMVAGICLLKVLFLRPFAISHLLSLGVAVAFGGLLYSGSLWIFFHGLSLEILDLFASQLRRIQSASLMITGT